MRLILIGALIGALFGFIVGVYRKKIVCIIKLAIDIWPLLLILYGILYLLIFHTSDAISIFLFIVSVAFLVFLGGVLEKRTIFNREEANCLVLGLAINLFFISLLVVQINEMSATYESIWAMVSIFGISAIQYFAFRRGIRRSKESS